MDELFDLEESVGFQARMALNVFTLLGCIYCVCMHMYKHIYSICNMCFQCVVCIGAHWAVY